jgi:hypothetical protein
MLAAAQGRVGAWSSAQVFRCNRVQKRHQPWLKQAPTRPHPFSGVSYVAKCSRLQTEECWSIDVTRTVDGWISEPVLRHATRHDGRAPPKVLDVRQADTDRQDWTLLDSTERGPGVRWG